MTNGKLSHWFCRVRPDLDDNITGVPVCCPQLPALQRSKMVPCIIVYYTLYIIQPTPTCVVFSCSFLYLVFAGYGRILMTTSVESQFAAPNYLPYSASKWSLMALQEEWYSTHTDTASTTNLDFVTILPGTVNTSLGYHAVYGKPRYVPHSLGEHM